MSGSRSLPDRHGAAGVTPGRVSAMARFLFVLTALSVAGCGGGPAVRPLDTSAMPDMEATAAELVEAVDARADSILGIKASLEMSFRRSPGGKARGCSGKLIAIRPAGGTGGARIYLKGYKRLVPTFFTLQSDGTGFWMYIPSEKVVYTGPFDRAAEVDTAEVDLEAADLAKALFVEPFDTQRVAGIGEDPGAYVLTLEKGGVLYRRLWIEKKLFAVVREKYYNRSGGEDLEIRRSEHATAGGVHYPLEITIYKPMSGREISLRIMELTINPAGVPPEAFRFEAPLGTRVIRIDGEDGS